MGTTNEITANVSRNVTRTAADQSHHSRRSIRLIPARRTRSLDSMFCPLSGGAGVMLEPLVSYLLLRGEYLGPGALRSAFGHLLIRLRCAPSCNEIATP